MRVLISTECNFWLTREAVERARELDATWAFPAHTPLVGEPEHYSYGNEDKEDRWDNQDSLSSMIPRHDPVLLQLYDELGNDMSPDNEVNCLTIPDDVTYYIGSYCAEWVSEQHREWHAEHDGDQPGGTPAFSIDSKFVS